MKTSVITTEFRLMQAIAPLVCNTPAEQIKWVQETGVPESFDLLESAFGLGLESDIGLEDGSANAEYVIAPAFMVVLVKSFDCEGVHHKVIDSVYFESTAAEATDLVLELCELEPTRRNELHLLMYHPYPNTGYKEIPFDIGYYLKSNAPAEKVRTSDSEGALTEKPKRVLFNWFDIVSTQHHKIPTDAEAVLFMEIPDVWDIKYIGCPCCGEEVNEVLVRKNLGDCFELAALRLKNAEYDAEFTISNTWYDYVISLNEEKLEAVFNEMDENECGAFHISTLLNAVEVESRRKY